MIVPEDKAKRLLARFGLPTPRGGVAQTPEAAVGLAEEMGGAAVIKALIPTGGRGKAGGVKICASTAEARQAAESLLGSVLLGHPVEQLLVETLIPIRQEIYAGVVVNTATDKIDLIVSLSGGVEIEAEAQKDSGQILHLAVEPGDLLPVHRLRRWLQPVKTNLLDPVRLAEILALLYRAAADLDARLIEINPLALAEDGSLVALDCKLEIDDNGLVRQPELVPWYLESLNARERRARDLGVSFVPLEGDVGLITSGAGLGMATLDLLKRAGLAPADFLDTGGGISKSLVQGALELVMEPPEVKGAIINLYGGINRMLEAAEGITAALQKTDNGRPIVVKILGNQQEEAWQMLEIQPNVHVIRVAQTEQAVAKLAELVG
jgi:succinyl-CoA synthetase beta subunit